jgi:hypothetical protein
MAVYIFKTFKLRNLLVYHVDLLGDGKKNRAKHVAFKENVAVIYIFSVLCCTVLVKTAACFYVNNCMYCCCNVDSNSEKTYFEHKL